MPTTSVTGLSYQDRIDALRATKLRHTLEKQAVEGAQDMDDFPTILPPPAQRELVRTMGGSGVEITTVRIQGVPLQTNLPDGGFYGPQAWGANFGQLLRMHPPYIDPVSSLAGAMMVNFLAYRNPHVRPDFFDYSHLHEKQRKYQISPGIGGAQHFCHDLQIGLEQGWQGILDRIRHYRQVNAPRGADLYDGLESVVLGMQTWIRHNAQAAEAMAQTEADPQLRQNLAEMADINYHLISEPPQTFREALQWILWFQLAAKMYNSNGALGRLDVLLLPYYERDLAAGRLTDEEAIFHLACFLERETPYIHLGGPDETGRDVTSRVSFLILEAAHRIKIPANIAVCVGKEVSPALLRRGVEILCEDKTGIPKFLGIDNCIKGFARNGYPLSLARQRAYAGCHWFGLPGREYTLNDCVKIGLGFVLDVALREMLADANTAPSVAELWQRFQTHLQIAVDATAEGLDLHLKHNHKVNPELVLDLLCYGPIERGLDASYGAPFGGVDHYNMCIDATGLATVADSLAALEQRLEQEQRLTWAELLHYLDTDWAGPEGERTRLMMRSVPRYGSGGSRADEWAVRVSRAFTGAVKARPTPAGFNLIPGLFSWALTRQYGQDLGPTPDGRHAGDPINQGANPYPGFRHDGASTALAVAVASVQSGYGNTAPMQIELDPGLGHEEHGVEFIEQLIKTHFDLGGTMININVVDANKIREANQDPTKYPDLVVRVTGFSAYFGRLSPEFRQMVVDRLISEE